MRSVVADVKLARQVTLNKTAADEQQRLQTLFKRSIALMQSETLRADAIKLGDKTKEREKVVVLAIMWITAAVSSLDRVAMSVALVSMSTEFGFSDTMKGLISSLFSVGYGVAILPAGLALSCLSPRLVMTFGLALWSIATVATPACAELLAHDVGAPIFFVRACVGVGESAMVPTIQRLLAVWTTVEQKSFGACVF